MDNLVIIGDTKNAKEMNDPIRIFSNPQFGDIRTAGTANEPLFCLADVCTPLGLTPKGVKQRLSDEVISNYPIIDNLNREQQALFINEDGLYDVILDSRKPTAKQFRKWVTSEVLPSIRKHGVYANQNLLDDPDLLISALQELKKERAEKALLEVERDRAIATKAYISGKKTATAMQTASVLSKENKKLRIEVDKSKDFATITAVEIKTKKRYRWQDLRNYCNAHELEMPKIQDKRYGSVRTYPARAWLNVFNVDLGIIL